LKLTFNLSKKNQPNQCLEWHSWLDYEHLAGLDSHLSRVYHTLATQVEFGLIAAESSMASELLARLKEAGFKSILLKLHTVDGELCKLAFFIPKLSDVDNAQMVLHSIMFRVRWGTICNA